MTEGVTTVLELFDLVPYSFALICIEPLTLLPPCQISVCSICLSIYLSIYLFIYLSMYTKYLCLFGMKMLKCTDIDYWHK